MYRAGDIVIVKTEDELDREFSRHGGYYDCDGLEFVDDMLRFCGCEMTVKYVSGNGQMKMVEDEEEWWFNESMVKPFNDDACMDLGENVLESIIEMITG